MKDTSITFEALVRLIEWQDGITEKEELAAEFLPQIFGRDNNGVDMGSYTFGDLIMDLVGIPREGEGGAGVRINSDEYNSADEYMDAYGFCRDGCSDLIHGEGTAAERATTLLEWYGEFKTSGRW